MGRFKTRKNIKVKDKVIMYETRPNRDARGMPLEVTGASYSRILGTDNWGNKRVFVRERWSVR